MWEQFLIDQRNNSNLPKIEDFSEESVLALNQSEEQKQRLIDSIVKYVLWQMDYDYKTTSLKQLQGNVWRKGYESGALKSE